MSRWSSLRAVGSLLGVALTLSISTACGPAQDCSHPSFSPWMDRVRATVGNRGGDDRRVVTVVYQVDTPGMSLAGSGDPIVEHGSLVGPGSQVVNGVSLKVMPDPGAKYVALQFTSVCEPDGRTVDSTVVVQTAKGDERWLRATRARPYAWQGGTP